jgi:adenylate cyclase
MAHSESSGVLKHISATAREYVTHWVIAGCILALTGFAPEHWIADFIHQMQIPERFLNGGMPPFDVRTGLVAVGGAMIGWDVVRRNKGKQLILSDRHTSDESNPSSYSKTSTRVVDDEATLTSSKPAALISESASELSFLTLPDRPSLAVLPFRNESAGPEKEYFAEGIVDDMTTALSRMKWLFVIARNLTFTYKDRAIDVRQIGRELGVRYVLQGGVRTADTRVRITGQLIDASTGRNIWADRFDGDLADVFDIQDRVTEKVVSAIEPSIRFAEIERSRAKRSQNLNAYDFYLQALPHLYAASYESGQKCLGLLQKSLDLEPSFGPAATALAICWYWRLAYGWSKHAEASHKFDEAIKIALDIDNEDPEALAWLARNTATFGRDYDQALLIANRALESNINSTAAWSNKAWVYLYREEPKLAKEAFDRALRLSPLDPFNYDTWVGVAINGIQLGQDDEAVTAARRAVIRNPQHAWAHRLLAISLSLAGHPAEASTAMKNAMHLDPDFSIEGFQAWNPFVHGFARYLEGFRLAGFPERAAG